jgi:hypothetical protein
MKKIFFTVLVLFPVASIGQTCLYKVYREDTSVFSEYNLFWLKTKKKRELQVLIDKKNSIQLKVDRRYKDLKLIRLDGIPHNGITIPFNGRDTYVDSIKIYIDEFYLIR